MKESKLHKTIYEVSRFVMNGQERLNGHLRQRPSASGIFSYRLKLLEKCTIGIPLPAEFTGHSKLCSNEKVGSAVLQFLSQCLALH